MSTTTTTAAVISSPALRALNAELVQLIRAGVPIEMGLQQLGNASSNRLSQLANRIGVRLSAGESLDAAVSAEETAEARLYATIIRLGMQSGRLPEMLESMAELGDQMAVLRQEFRRSSIYPTIVLVLSYVMICAMSIWFIPRWLLTLESFNIDGGWMEVVLRAMHDHAAIWMPTIPVFGLIVLYLLGSTPIVRAGLLANEQGAWPSLQVVSGGLAWLLGVPDAVRWVQWLYVTSLLTKEGLPFEDCLVQSEYLLGSGRMRADAREARLALASGVGLGAALIRIRDLPTFVADAIEIGVRTNTLPLSLELSTGVMLRRVHRKVEILAGIVPLVLTAVVGGGCALAYAMMVFGPLTVFWSGLSLPM